jgi:ABC-type multidrug transport system fused ATPase/permease subunit
MSGVEAGSDESGDDPFAEQRERVDDPMRRLVGDYGRPYWLAVALGIGASLGARLLDLLPTILLGIAIDSLFQGIEPFSLPVVPQAWLPAAEVDQFFLVIGLITGSFVVGAGFHWLRNWGFNSFAQDIQHDVRTDSYDTMQRLNMSFFADKQTGELMSILSNDVNQLERFLNDGLNSAFRLVVMVVAIAGYLLYLNPQLALVALSPVPLIAIFTYIFIKNPAQVRCRPLQRRHRELPARKQSRRDSGHQILEHRVLRVGPRRRCFAGLLRDQLGCDHDPDSLFPRLADHLGGRVHPHLPRRRLLGILRIGPRPLHRHAVDR